MKGLIARTLASLMFAVVGLAVTAPAQSTPTIKVSIPFEFSFGERTFAAGDYALSQPMDHFLILRDSQGENVAQSITENIESAQPSDKTKLKFYSSGGKYVLGEVWQGESYSGVELYKAKPRNVEKGHSVEVSEVRQGSQRSQR